MNDLINNNGDNVFFENVALTIEQARNFVGRTADLTMCITYFEIGCMIVEEEQGGRVRAEYGRGLMQGLADYLTEKFGRGYSLSTLKNAKQFYSVYAPVIRQTASETPAEKSQSLLGFFENGLLTAKSQTMISQLYPFNLSWSHYLILMRIKSDNERRFYEMEAAKQRWTYRQLQRQYGSSLYERLALSRDKDEVMRLAQDGQVMEKSRDLLKNPLVLEFLDLAEDSSYSETDLENAIISKLSHFLLELGKGFLFEARQKRFTFDEDHFIVDLIFYNRLLGCYVLIDLKNGKLKHQDLGQMSMYVNYFDRYVKTDKEKPTVGILLCREKNDSVVELTLPENSNIYASEYSLYLPDKALLRRKLAEWVEEFEEYHEAKSNEIKRR
ncbi:MAG: PDDEXK nuclease domain-containing protein [Oscillospiraceae bacterium]|nr:PDDEXK nuclease domain-containing protein [Oscillospiraceae bacterium]